MVPKISPARESARSCFEYDIRPKNGQSRGEWIAGTLGGTPRQMARLAASYRSLRPDCKKPVWRCSLSLPPSDGRPTPQKWAQIAQDFLAEMGVPTDAAWVAMHHGDVDHDHIHITLLRTLPDGTLWSEERSAKRAIKACAALEARHQLATHDRTPKPKTAPTRAEAEIFNRQQKKTGKPIMSREHIQAAVDQVLADYPQPKGIDFVDLQRILADLKPPIDLQASMPKGVFRGVSYQYDSFKWPGSKIGREYSVGLVERGVRMPGTKTSAPPEVSDPFISQASQPAPQADQYARAPAPLRQMLREQRQTRQLVPTPQQDADTQPAKKVSGFEIDLAEVRRGTQDLGPLTQAMALIGAACLKFSLSFLKALIGWLKKLLVRFGVGIAERPQQLASGSQAVSYEPFTIDAETREVTNTEAAVQLVNQVTSALESKDAALLPKNVEGRDAIAAAMLTDPGREAEPDVLDTMFLTEVEDAAAPAPVPPEATPANPPKRPLVQFMDAAKSFVLAAELVRVASLKDIMYVDGRPQAQKRHDEADALVFQLETAVAGWRAKHKVASAVGADPLGFKPRLEAARARAATTQAALQQADREHADFLVVFAKTPVPDVPCAVQDRHAAASAELKAAQELLLSRARLNLTILDFNPMLRQKKEAFDAQLRRAETRLAAFLVDPRTQPNVVKDIEDMIQSLTIEVAIERARLAPRPDSEEGQDADEAGQRGFAAPGQR